MFAAAPNPFVFVGKKELVNIPFFGYLFKRAAIMVDRSSSKVVMGSMAVQRRYWIKATVSVFFLKKIIWTRRSYWILLKRGRLELRSTISYLFFQWFFWIANENSRGIPPTAIRGCCVWISIRLCPPKGLQRKIFLSYRKKPMNWFILSWSTTPNKVLWRQLTFGKKRLKQASTPSFRLELWVGPCPLKHWSILAL